MEPTNNRRTDRGIPTVKAIVREVHGRVKVTPTNSSNEEVGITGKPITVTAVGSGGGTPTADVNLHAADGTAITETAGAVDVYVANPTDVSLLATQATLSALNAKVTACNTGAVVLASGTITNITNAVAVTGTFWQTTQPISGTVAVTTVKPDGTNTQPSMDAVARAGFQKIVETAPDDTSKYNCSVALTWTGEELTTIAKTVSGVTKSKTLTWAGGKLTALSAWS